MSVQQDRLTFFGVLLALFVVVVGYLQLGRIYPMTGGAEPTVQATEPETQLDSPDTPQREERAEE